MLGIHFCKSRSYKYRQILQIIFQNTWKCCQYLFVFNEELKIRSFDRFPSLTSIDDFFFFLLFLLPIDSPRYKRNPEKLAPGISLKPQWCVDLKLYSYFFKSWTYGDTVVNMGVKTRPALSTNKWEDFEYSESQNGWGGKGPVEVIQSEGLLSSLLKQGHLRQVALDHIQAAFEKLQAGRLHSPSGQPVPMHRHLHNAGVLPDV